MHFLDGTRIFLIAGHRFLRAYCKARTLLIFENSDNALFRYWMDNAHYLANTGAGDHIAKPFFDALFTDCRPPE